MNVTYRETARQPGEGYSLLQQATEQLKEVLGPSADQVSVEWDRSQDDRGRILYTLTISDQTGEARATFAPGELASPTQMRMRLYRLWGGLAPAALRRTGEKVAGARQGRGMTVVKPTHDHSRPAANLSGNSVARRGFRPKVRMS